MFCMQLVKRRLWRYSHAQLLVLFAPLFNARLSSTTWSQGLGEALPLRSWRWCIALLLSFHLSSSWAFLIVLVCFRCSDMKQSAAVYNLYGTSFFCAKYSAEVDIHSLCMMTSLLMFAKKNLYSSSLEFFFPILSINMSFTFCFRCGLIDTFFSLILIQLPSE